MRTTSVGRSNAASPQLPQVVAMFALLACSATAILSAAEGDTFKRKQQAQEKARGLAGELILVRDIP